MRCKTNFNHFTQNGHHGAVLQYFHRAGAYKVDSLERVALSDKELSRSWKGRLDYEGQGTQTPPAGWFKERQFQQLFVQVHGDVGPQLIWEIPQ